MVLWVGLQFVIMVFPDHTRLLCSVGINAKLYFLNRLSDKAEELLAIRRIFSLVGMITDTNFSNCPNVF